MDDPWIKCGNSVDLASVSFDALAVGEQGASSSLLACAAPRGFKASFRAAQAQFREINFLKNEALRERIQRLKQRSQFGLDQRACLLVFRASESKI